MASKNAALAFGFEDLGTFANKKIPGVNLITNVYDFKMTECSEVIKIY